MRMSARLKPLAFPIVALCIIVAGVVTYAAHVSAEPQASSYAEYTNDRWHFSIVLPDNMTVSEHDQPGDGQTIQFGDASGNFQFQISAYHYSQLDLTLGRVGAASGPGDQPDHLEIVDTYNDDTFNVLFEKRGIRYAVVALPKHEADVVEILKTWQFN
jgi:hypothetical protein